MLANMHRRTNSRSTCPRPWAEVRSESWAEFSFPVSLSRLFQTSGAAIAGLVVVAFALLFALARFVGNVGDETGQGFYQIMSHSVMVSIFMPAFLLPFLAIGLGLWRYWQHVGGSWIRPMQVARAMHAAATVMKNLSGGHGEGCNFEGRR